MPTKYDNFHESSLKLSIVILHKRKKKAEALHY